MPACHSIVPLGQVTTLTTLITQIDISRLKTQLVLIIGEGGSVSWSVMCSWMQVSGPNLTDSAFAAVMEAQSRLVLPEWSLDAGMTYAFEVLVEYTDVLSGLVSNNTAIGTVSVGTSDLVARVEPSSSRFSVSVGVVYLSASDSFDPDSESQSLSALTDPSASEQLYYRWACVRSVALDNGQSELQDCLANHSSQEGLGQAYAELFFPVESDFYLNNKFEFSVTVISDPSLSSTSSANTTLASSLSANVRSAQADALLTFVLEEVPELVIVASSASLSLYGKHNTQDRLTLSATAPGFAVQDLTWQWSYSAGDLTSASRLTDTVSANLVLANDALVAGTTVTFEVSGSVIGASDLGAGWASLSLEVNGPPSSGTCSVTLGAALEAAVLLCTGWTDDAADLPLQYQFSYRSPGASFVHSLSGLQSSNRAEVISFLSLCVCLSLSFSQSVSVCVCVCLRF